MQCSSDYGILHGRWCWRWHLLDQTDANCVCSIPFVSKWITFFSFSRRPCRTTTNSTFHNINDDYWWFFKIFHRTSMDGDLLPQSNTAHLAPDTPQNWTRRKKWATPYLCQLPRVTRKIMAKHLYNKLDVGNCLTGFRSASIRCSSNILTQPLRRWFIRLCSHS